MNLSAPISYPEGTTEMQALPMAYIAKLMKLVESELTA